jgi:hypothetical protein
MGIFDNLFSGSRMICGHKISPIVSVGVMCNFLVVALFEF